MLAQGQYFEQSECFLRGLVAGHILRNRLGLTVLRNHHRLASLAEGGQNLSRMGLEVSDGFDL